MFSYHRLWLSMLVLAFLTNTMCGFANEVEISISDSTSSNNADLKHDGHHLETQAAAGTLKDITDAGGGGGGGGGSGGDADDLGIQLHRLRFEPAQLDFGVWSVGTVQSHTVTLINQNRNRSVYLSSVSGRTPAFYISLFEAKTVPPNGNTTFDVVFLPREQGAVSTSLHIHTSFGKLLLMVKGEGRDCPYRLKPLVDIRAPLNATLMPMIHMYNPHEKSLQILEIYSSGGQFQLELPSGNPEAPQGLWEIPPYTTKPIIRIRFQGYTAGNHSAYIRIKIAEPHHNREGDGDANEDNESSSSTSSSHTKEQVLVIPVEFEILPEYGLYAENPILEFGYIAIDEETTTKPFKQKLFLRHSKTQLQLNQLKFESITYIRGVMMATAEDDTTSNDEISIDPKDIIEPVTRLNERLQLVLKDTTATAAAAAHTYHNVELIIRAHIYKGSLHYDKNSTQFLHHKVPLSTTAASSLAADNVENFLEKERHILLRNDFQIPLTIYNVTTAPHNDTSKLSLHLQPFEDRDGDLVLQPGLSLELLVAFRLAKRPEQTQQQQQEDLKDLTRNYKTAIYVYTNITNFQIPIVISSTRLFVSTQTLSIWRSNNSVYTKELQLSSIPFREDSHKGFIILQNLNSIPIKLNDWDFQKAPGVCFTVKFAGSIEAADIKKKKSNDYTVDLEKCDYKFTSELQEGDIAVFELALRPYTTELSTAYLKIATSYENITIAVKFSIVLGKLEVDQEKLHFENCFPGKICSSELSIRSSFKQAIHMKYINFTDTGLRFEDRNPQGSKIAPHSVTTVGRIYFEPSALCGTRCYIPQHTDEASAFPTSTQLENTLNMPHFDEVELRRRTELYRHFKYYFQNLDFTMTTKEMQHFQLNLMIEIQWPQLVTSRQVLPTIEVNKTQLFEVKISNPSDKPILIDYILADPTLAKETQISLPLEVIILTPSCYLTDKGVFSLVSQPPKKPILIPALTSIKVPIQFQASSMGNYCTLLHIRNNLTLYEGIWISAKAVQSQFRLGNRKPGSPTPLLFEITEQQLATACAPKEEVGGGSEKPTTQPQVFSRRVFTARNSGELPIWIDSFWIGDQPCKGYGFQVMDCKSFELKANSTKVIEIVFQTDFTVTRISKTLTLKTNLSYAVNYMLVAQLPSKGLEQCTALLPRPPWEEKIRNATIVMLMITFVLVLIAVHIDYGNIMYTQSTLYGAREKGIIHPTFNLRNIAMRSTSQNNNDSPVVDGELTQRSKATATGLKKRNVAAKNQKLTNGETSTTASSSSSSSFTALPNLTLAEMVSWTFGTKSSKKANKTNKGKENQNTTATVSAATASSNLAATSDLKSAKTKLSEKSLVDKMDEDMKKAQTASSKKPIKSLEKTNSRAAAAIEEPKPTKDEATGDKEVKKERVAITKSTTKIGTNTNTPTQDTQNSPKEHRKSLESSSSAANLQLELQTRQAVSTPSPTTSSPSASPSPMTASKTPLASLIIPMTEITNQQTPLAKDNANGRKLGKTPGRERRKQSVQNTSPATSSCSSNSASSSSCPATQAHGMGNSAAAFASTAGGKQRYERKLKNKAANSLKFSPNSHSHHNGGHLLYSSSAAAAMANAANGNNDQTFHQDVLSPWDYSSHITFSDVLQQTQQFANSQAAAMNSATTSPSLLHNNTDLMQQYSTSSSLFDAMSPASTAPSTPNSAAPSYSGSQQFSRGENSEITAALTPKRPVKTANDLGPIGSRKSPSSTPSWEPLNSAITMQQIQRPLNTTIATTSATTLPYDLQQSPNFGFNDLITARQTIQQIASAPSQPLAQHNQAHDFDIAAKLRAIKAQEIMRLQQLEQHLLMQQQQQQQQLQHQQYLNYTSGLSNNWPSASAWTSFMGNGGVNGNLANCNPSDVFGTNTSTSPSASSTWSAAQSGLEHHYAANQQHLSPLTSEASSSSVSASNSSVSSSFDNNNVTTTTNGGVGGLNSTDNPADNMPMFNLFGGLSSIWNDNWKQSTQQKPQMKPE